MDLRSVNRLRISGEYAKQAHEHHSDITKRDLAKQRSLEDKEKRETCYFFVSEIERAKAQIKRLQMTGEIGDVMVCQHYERLISENTKKMEAKFSKEEIEKTQNQYKQNPVWNYLTENQR